MTTMAYSCVVVPTGEAPTNAQVRLGLDAANDPALFASGGSGFPNGDLFIADATGLTNATDYDAIVVVDGPLETLRGLTSFRTGGSSLANAYVEQYEEDGQPVVKGWSDDPRRG